MTEKQSKFVEAVARLIKLTQDGELMWESSKPSAELERDGIKDESVFISRYKDRILRLYKYSYRVDEPGLFDISTSFFPIKVKYPYWASSVTLEFIDDNGFSLWKFPFTNALNDLFQAVQYQFAGVDEFLDKLLNE